MPTNTPDSALLVILSFAQHIKKAQVSVLLSILEPQALALPTSHRIDNAS